MAEWEPVVPPSVACLVDWFSLFSTLSKAHLGYLYLVRTSQRWSFSCWSSSGLLHTVEALWERVWITLNLAERWWWLSHCKYWSVWMGFLYTVMDSVPSASGLTTVSSTANFMAGSTLFMCWRKPCLLTSLWMTNVSSTYQCQNLGGGAVFRAFCFQVLHVEIGHNGAGWGTHGCTLNLFIELVLEREVCVLETKLQ